jgi:magnesium transporter
MRFLKRQSKKLGLPPGTILHIGEQKVEKTIIEVIDFDKEKLQKVQMDSIKEIFKFKDTSTTSWINIVGLHETEIMQKIGQSFDFHPLVIEDILNTDQRPKIEFFDNYIFIIMKMIIYDTEKMTLNIEQVSIILGQNYVFTFQERRGDVFQPIRERLKNIKGRLRNNSHDYLTYALMDVIVDNYFVVLENISDDMEYLEESVTKSPDQSLIEQIYNIKRELLLLKKAIWPLRDIVNNLRNEETELIFAGTEIYFNDLSDHTIQLIEVTETYRDLASGLLDTYMSMVSHRMNEVMKVLTIIATIFIPLTFIAGIYGMNFEVMPELKWKWGYFTVWGFMIVTFIGMLFYFRRKKWI